MEKSSTTTATGSKPKQQQHPVPPDGTECKGSPATRILYLYDTELKKCLQDLTVLSSLGNNKEDHSEVLTNVTHKARDLQISSTLTCTSCTCNFANHDEQRAHYKTDWHRFNLKQKIKGQSPIDQENFSQLHDRISDSNQAEHSRSSSRRQLRPSPIPSYVFTGREASNSESSSSDTDSETESSSYDDDDIKHYRNAKVHFRNGEQKILSVYRCILFPKQMPPAHDGELIRLLCNVPDKLLWTIILIGGGRFAAAVFTGQTVVLHKTFRRYTIRAKQGTMQSTKDNQNGPQHRSAGAGLRRHNEMALVQDIQTLLESWAAELNRSDCIFYRAPGPNKTILFGGKAPALKKSDLRLRPIPFPTGRATFYEVMRIHEVLSCIECCDSIEVATSACEFPKRQLNKTSNKGRKPKRGNQQENLRKSLTKQGEPCFEHFSCSSDSDSVSLIEDDEILTTSHLKIFEGTRKPRNRNRKKTEK